MKYSLSLLVLTLFTIGVARCDDVIDSPMYRDPVLPESKSVKVFDPKLIDSWILALGRPEQEMKTSAATAIATAHLAGMKGLSATIEPLRKVLDQPDQHPSVQWAVSKALVALDAKSTADSLLKVADNSANLRDVIFPSLAKWNYAPAHTLWLNQIAKPAPYLRNHVLATQALAAVKEEKAIPRLRELLFAFDTSPAYRLELSRALSMIRTAGGEADARQLSADPLAGVTLLRHHSGDETVKLLKEFAVKSETSVAARAVERLLELDPKLVLPVLNEVLKNGDSEARKLGVEAMLRVPNADHLPKLGTLLSDSHPDVRRHAQHTLVKYAEQPALRKGVEEQCTKAINGNDWQGQEQAALLAGQLKFKPVAKRLVELLAVKQPDTFIAAAWALRVVAVPDTLPAVNEFLKLRHKQLLSYGKKAGMDNVTPEQIDDQMTQLVQFIGLAEYEPGNVVLRAMVPRFIARGAPPKFTPVGPETRAACIWSLGKIYAGLPDPKLVDLILERMTGDSPQGVDDHRVRRMVPIAMARMKAEMTLPVLKQFSVRQVSEWGFPVFDDMVYGCRWAVSQFDGKPFQEFEVTKVPQVGWFLVPNK